MLASGPSGARDAGWHSCRVCDRCMCSPPAVLGGMLWCHAAFCPFVLKSCFKCPPKCSLGSTVCAAREFGEMLHVIAVELCEDFSGT